MTDKNNIGLRKELRTKLLDILNKELDLAKLGTTDKDTAYTDVAYEMLYVFDSLITGSTLNYYTEKHDAVTDIADYVYRYTKQGMEVKEYDNC